MYDFMVDIEFGLAKISLNGTRVVIGFKINKLARIEEDSCLAKPQRSITKPNYSA